MVGRDAEARALEQGWRAGQIVVVTGEAGMGKTRLLQDFAQPRPGVVHVSARPGDASVPLATLARLLRAVAAAQPAGMATGRSGAAAVNGVAGGAGAGAATSAGIELIAPTADNQAPGSAAAQRLQLQRDVAQRLREQPAVAGLLLDDLHFADSASLDLLQALLDEPADEPAPHPGARPAQARPAALALAPALPGLGLHWALAWRAAEVGSTLQALHDTLAEQARLRGVALQPLDEPALAELVDSLALPGLDGALLAAALHRRTGGNPLFVLETLKLAWVEQRLVDGPSTALTLLPKPASVTRLIERRLAQLSPAAMALARCAAVAGSEFSSTLAARVLGTSPLALADAWQELEAAQVLRDEAFVHDLLYEATLASVPAPIARLLHGEIAAQLQAEGRAAPATLARHWLAAGQPGQARPQLEQAASAATQALDAREAGRLWLQLADVHEAASAQPAAFEAAGRAVHALRELTTGAELEAAIDRMAALARTPVQQAEAQRRRVELHMTRGDIAQATAAVQAALAALAVLGPAGAPTDRSDLLNLQGVLYRRVGRLHDARQSLEEALALARAHASPTDDYAGVLNNLGLVLQSQDEHLAAIGLLQESAERQHDPATRARVLNNLAISLEERGQVELAHQQRLSAARAVSGSGSVVERVLAIALGSGARHLCRYREALQHFEHARSIGSGQKHYLHENLLRHIAALWIDLGRINLAQQTLVEAQQLAESAADQALLDIVRAQALLAQGPAQAGAALALLQPAEALFVQGGDRRVVRRVWLVQAAALPAEQAVPLLQSQLAQDGMAANPGAALPLQVRLAQALLATGDNSAAHRAAERAADWLAAVQPMEMTPAEVWLTLARCARAVGDAPAARSACQRGLDFVAQVARDHLDAVYRDGWMQRNLVNAALAVLGAQLLR